MFKILSKKEYKEMKDKINELIKITNELVEKDNEPKPQYFGG